MKKSKPRVIGQGTVKEDEVPVYIALPIIIALGVYLLTSFINWSFNIKDVEPFYRFVMAAAWIFFTVLSIAGYKSAKN